MPKLFQSRFSRVLRDSTPCYVSPSIRPSIHPSIHPLVHHFTFSAFMGFLGMPLLPRGSPNQKYGPWPPDATGVALYLALLVADWFLYKRLCPSTCLLVCVHKWRKQAFPAHCLGLVLAVYPALFYLFWSKLIISFTIRMSASKTIFFCVYQTLISGVSFLHIVVFMKRQKWCF